MTHYKYLTLSTMVIILSIILISCGENEPPPTSKTSQNGAFKVALIIPGPIDDQGFSQIAYEGLKTIEQELAAQISYTADTADLSEAELEQLLRQYAAEGYDFIIGHETRHIAPAEIVAEEFPRTNFAVVANYAGNNKNLGALGYRAHETGYLLGVLAALKTQTNKVAFIGGLPSGSTGDVASAFEQGAKATNPAIEVSVEWVGGWRDADKTQELTQNQLEFGADVLMIQAGRVSEVGFKLVERAGLYAIGATTDQHDLAPNTILSSSVRHPEVILLEAATLVQQRRWQGKQYRFGLQEGALELAPFYGLLTPEEEEIINTVQNDIITNKITVLP